jgi:hypothetical protein
MLWLFRKRPNTLLFADSGNPLVPAIGAAMALSRNTTGSCWVYDYTTKGALLATIPAGVERFWGYAWDATNSVWHTAFSDGSAVNLGTSLAGRLPGVLIESQATNLCLHSQIDSGWNLGGCTVTANSVAAPDGTTTGALFTETSGTSQHEVYSAAMTVVAGTLSGHVDIKAGTRRYIQIAIGAGATGEFGVVIDTTASCAIVSSGTNHTATYISGVVTALAGGWYRISLIGTVPATTAYISLDGSSSATFGVPASSSGSQTFYFCDAQVTQSAQDGSHIQTTTTAVTRSADVISGSTANILHADTGKIQIQFCPSWTGGNQYLWGSYTDSSNWTRLYYDGTTFIFEARIAGTTYQATYTTAISAGTQYTVTALWTSSVIRIRVNGMEGVVATIPNQIVLASTHQLGADGNSAGQHGGTHQSMKVWRRAA